MKTKQNKANKINIAKINNDSSILDMLCFFLYKSADFLCLWTVCMYVFLSFHNPQTILTNLETPTFLYFEIKSLICC